MSESSVPSLLPWEEAAPAERKIENLEAALKRAQEELKEAKYEISAASAEIKQLKATNCPKELKIFVHGYDTPVVFHPRLRKEVVDAWWEKVDDMHREGNLETVPVVSTDEEWHSFYRYGGDGREAPPWASMESTDDEDDEESTDDEDDEKF